MNDASIATVEQFKQALLLLRNRGITPTWLKMLCAQGRAPNGTITASDLASAAGYENFNAANLNYGKLARALAEILNFMPGEVHRDGSVCWWTTLSHGRAADPGSDQDFQFTMRTELLQALIEMKWVKTPT
jgi:predicted HNH restriction endonuclease